MGGWASNSKYPFLGAIRSAAQMVSYEVSIGIIIINVLLCVGSLNLNDIVLAQEDLWFVIESLLKIAYGQDAFDMIMWFILDRFNPDGKVVPFEDEKGKQFSLITAKDLFHFLKHRFPN